MRPDLDSAIAVEVAILPPTSPCGGRSTRQIVAHRTFDLAGIAIAIGDGDVRFYSADGTHGDALEDGIERVAGELQRGARLVAVDATSQSLLLQMCFGVTVERTFDGSGYARFLDVDDDRRWLAPTLGVRWPTSSPTPRGNADVAAMAEATVAVARALFARSIVDDNFPDIEYDAMSHTVRLALRGISVDRGRIDEAVVRLIDRRDEEVSAFASRWRFDQKHLDDATRVTAFLQQKFGVRLEKLSKKHDPYIRCVAAGGELSDFLLARERLLRVKTVLERTKSYRILADHRLHGLVRYYAAHTGRFASGGPEAEGLDLHGLAKATSVMPELGLERTVVVPDAGRHLAAADLASVEARVVAWLAAEEELLDRIRAGDDIYAWFAGKIYPGRTITKHGENAQLRAIGKEAVLGLGFGMGRSTFARRVLSRGILCDDADIGRAFDTYRASFRRIAALRGELAEAVRGALDGTITSTDRWTVLPIEPFGDANPAVAIKLPTGRSLFYRSLKVMSELTPWMKWEETVWYAKPNGRAGAVADAESKLRTFPDGVVRARLTAPMLVENVVQAIARDILVHQVMELERIGYPVAWHHHDEIVIATPGCDCLGPCAEICPCRRAREQLLAVMSAVPAALGALSELPLLAEPCTTVHRHFA